MNKINHPVRLEGNRIRLLPLGPNHFEELRTVALDPEIWKWISYPVTTAEQLHRYLVDALALREQGTAYPFVTVERASNQIVGCTRFGTIDTANLKLEIGWTWVIPRWQRSFVNTESKFLMLQYAFEELGCRRVELKTDALNTRSRSAILRLGAKEEGILRNHMLTQSGRMRDTVYFSILDSEWSAVKTGLMNKLNG